MLKHYFESLASLVLVIITMIAIGVGVTLFFNGLILLTIVVFSPLGIKSVIWGTHEVLSVMSILPVVALFLTLTTCNG